MKRTPLSDENTKERHHKRELKNAHITIEFMFAGINIFWVRLRLILARAARRGLK